MPPSPGEETVKPWPSSRTFPLRWNDVPAAIIFSLHFGLFLLAAVYFTIIGYVPLGKVARKTMESLVLKFIAWQTGVTISVSLVLTVLVHYLLQWRPRMMMHLFSLMSVALLASWTIQDYIYSRLWLMTAIYGIVTIVVLVVYLLNIRHIPISASLLQSVSFCTHRYPKLLSTLVLVTLIGHLYGVLANLTLNGLDHYISIAFGPMAWMIGVYLGFSVWWTAQVLVNIFCTVVAGVFAFDYGQSLEESSLDPVPQLLSISTRQAFGSICLASTLVSPIVKIRSMLYRIVKIAHVTWAPIQTLLAFFDWAARHFNYFAFNHVAILNEPYRLAANRTWDAVRANQVHTVMGDVYMAEFTLFTALMIGLIAAYGNLAISVIGYAIPLAECTRSFVGSVLLGMVIPKLYLDIIESGALATLVCVADEPSALRNSNPALYTIIAEKYPQVLQNVSS